MSETKLFAQIAVMPFFGRNEKLKELYKKEKIKMDLQSKILEVIKENLSSAQLGLLKDHFEQYSKDQKELEGLRNYKNNTEIILHEITRERDELKVNQKNNFEAHRETMRFADEVAKKNQELELLIAKANLEACRKSYSEMKDLMSIVFRNPKFIHTLEHSEHQQGHHSAQGWVGDQFFRKTFVTTSEQE